MYVNICILMCVCRCIYIYIYLYVHRPQSDDMVARLSYMEPVGTVELTAEVSEFGICVVVRHIAKMPN